VVRGWVVGDAQLEAIAVTLEILEVPEVEPVAPGVYLVKRHRRTEHVQVQAVVDVIPQTSVAKDVALALAVLAGETICALAVLAGVAVAVGVEVDDLVVGGGSFELEAGLVVVVRRETFVVVV
jgi:hypothetical protein